jgi:hypothetical protein
MKTRFLTLWVTLLLLTACGEIIVTPIDEASIQPTEIPTKTAAVLPTEDRKPETVLLSECTVVSSQPEPPAEFVELFSVNANDWVTGREDAAVTLIEYGDFQ